MEITVSVRFYFVPEGLITPSVTIKVGQIVTERNVSVSSIEQKNDRYDALLQAEKKAYFGKLCFHRQVLLETLAPGSSTA
jgi:hypothetical protein